MPTYEAKGAKTGSMWALPTIGPVTVGEAQDLGGEPLEELAEALAERIYHEVTVQVPAYSAITDPTVRDDVRRVMNRVARLYCEAVVADHLPGSRDVGYLADVGRREARWAVPLEAVLQSNRIGAHLLWTHLLDLCPSLDEGQSAVRTLRFTDALSTSMTQGYLDERRLLAESQEEARRLFLTRIVSDDVEEQEEQLLAEGRELGLDLSVPNVAALVAPAQTTSVSDAEADVILRRVRPALHAILPEAPLFPIGPGLLAVIPLGSGAEAAGSILSGIKPLLRPGLLVVATGTARAGIHGLTTSYREAKRALALGALVEATSTVYVYEELQIFDLFKEGDAIDHFVSEILSPILKERGTKRRELLKTLEVLFRTGQNRKQAAHELEIHVNTLAYRIHRLEELLGESLTLGERAGDTSFRLQLALRLLPMSRLAELD